MVYPQYTILRENITQRQEWQYHYQSIHNTLLIHKTYCNRTSHKETATAGSIYIYTQHQTAEEYHAEMTAAESVYTHYNHTREEHHTEIQQQYRCPQYILRQIITTQRDSNSSITISLSTLQKNITQRDSNGGITVSPSTIHCTAKEHHTKRRQRLYYYSSTVSVHPQNFVCKV